jgi:SP family myo-inositol transporter-like MFS transporter 13
MMSPLHSQREAPEASEPLISDHLHEQQDSHSRDDIINHEPLNFRNAGRIVQFLTLSAGLSGLLFGYDTGVISSTLVTIGTDLSGHALTSLDKGLITAITSILALIAAPFTGYFADRFGRKAVILVPAMLFIVGAIVQAAANGVWMMVLGRALIGVAVGVASGASPLYITELSPAELRGRLVTIQSLFVTGGQVIAYLTGYGFSNISHGWRFMVGLGALPAVIQLMMLIWMPESPRWLLQKGYEQRAQEVLTRTYADLPASLKSRQVNHVLRNMRAEIFVEDETTDGLQASHGFRRTTQELIKVPGNRRALTIACLLQGLQQLSGFVSLPIPSTSEITKILIANISLPQNCLMYFSATIFSLIGFRSPIGTSLAIALTNFFFTLLAFTWIDRLGRRAILLRTIPLMALGLLLCSIAFLFVPITTNSPQAHSNVWSVVLLLSMILYVASYASGLGCVPWQQSELFPLRVRSLGSGLATATNWSSNAVIGITFLPLMEFLGASATFGLYAAICLLGWVLVHRIYPETSGLELEDVGDLLSDGWGVERSVRRFRERRAAVVTNIRES